MGTQRWTCLLGVCLCLAAGMESTVAAVGPDAGDEAAASPRGAVAESLDPACDTFGFFDNPWSRSYRYRGNAFHLEFRAVLKEIKMELAFSGTTDLHVAIHRQQPDGCYKLHVPIIDLINVRGVLDPISGLPVPHFYTTGVLDPPVTLEPGFKYAIAFAWGETAITHGYDVQASPFRAGQFLGLVAATLSPPPDPLVPETLCLDPYAGYAYSMQLCFEPQIGACCRASDQRCHEVLESECTGAGDFFHGEYTRCAVTPCIFGACCKPCGTCDNDHAPEACVAAAGVAHWSDVSCPATPELLCPPVTGACCTTNGTCTETCQALCIGTFRGVGTSCEPNICRGACCIPTSGCSERTQTSCTQFQGQFRGLGTTCDSLPPHLQCGIGGACCYGGSALTFCQRVDQREFCPFDAFTVTGYRGDGTTCGSSPCGDIINYHACCLPDGTCVNMASTDSCTAIGVHGEYNASKRCEEFANGCPTEAACCLPDGSCDTLTFTGCTAKGGSQPGPTVCGLDTCPTGACCDGADGLCVVQTQAACIASGGSYCGNSTNCNTPALVCPGIGACCRYDGDCFDNFTWEQCTTIDGTYEGNATVCDAPPCVDERRACCAITGRCLLLTEAQCNGPNGIGGEFKRTVAACSANTCPAGACCLSTGCDVRTVSNCASSAGVLQGLNVACEPDLCVFGACCNGETCSSQTRHTCERDGGTYLGDGVACSATVCTLGACCQNEACSQLQALPCTQQGGVFLGGGVVCAADTCNTGACCRSEACATGIKFVCTRDGGTYLGDGEVCSPTTCTNGACCTSGECQAVPTLICRARGGTFLGLATACDADTCTPGACCKNDGCTQDLGLLCTQRNGVFLGPRQACAVGLCHIGGCCQGETCQTAINFLCTGDGGTFLGIGALCDVDTCTLGACCTGMVCSRDIRYTCLHAGHLFKGPGTSCDSPAATCCTDHAQCDDRRACTLNDRCEGGFCARDWRAGYPEWQQMANCLSQSGPSPPVPADCDCYDINRDGHVDLHDVARFLVDFSGP